MADSTLFEQKKGMRLFFAKSAVFQRVSASLRTWHGHDERPQPQGGVVRTRLGVVRVSFFVSPMFSWKMDGNQRYLAFDAMFLFFESCKLPSFRSMYQHGTAFKNDQIFLSSLLSSLDLLSQKIESNDHHHWRSLVRVDSVPET